jgi:hypothetical protein
MADKALFARAHKCVTGCVRKCKRKIRKATARLSPQQRIVLLAILFATFVVVDIIYIAQGFKGDNTDSLEIQHLKQMETEIFNTTQNDTTTETGIGQ